MVEIELPGSPAIPPLGVYPEQATRTRPDVCTPVFTAALVTVTKTWGKLHSAGSANHAMKALWSGKRSTWLASPLLVCHTLSQTISVFASLLPEYFHVLLGTAVLTDHTGRLRYPRPQARVPHFEKLPPSSDHALLGKHVCAFSFRSPLQPPLKPEVTRDPGCSGDVSSFLVPRTVASLPAVLRPRPSLWSLSAACPPPRGFPSHMPPRWSLQSGLICPRAWCTSSMSRCSQGSSHPSLTWHFPHGCCPPCAAGHFPATTVLCPTLHTPLPMVPHCLCRPPRSQAVCTAVPCPVPASAPRSGSCDLPVSLPSGPGGPGGGILEPNGLPSGWA